MKYIGILNDLFINTHDQIVNIFDFCGTATNCRFKIFLEFSTLNPMCAP